jgi:DNA-directed RNA polymerase subunit RPC12/RpoP
MSTTWHARTPWIVCVLALSLAAERGGAQPAKTPQPRNGMVCLLINKNSGRCLSVKDNSDKPGARIVQGPMPEEAGASERWMLLGADKTFRLRNETSKFVLEIGSANKAPGVQAIQWHDQVKAKQQHWTFEALEDEYVLHTGHSSMVLCVQEGALTAGANVIQWNKLEDVPDQLWELRPFEKTYAQEFRHPLKGDVRNNAPFEPFGSDTDQSVLSEADGLRIKLPPGRAEHAGLKLPIVVKGDFEITLNFDLLKEPEQADTGKVGSRFSLGIFLATPKSCVATINRSMSAKQGPVFVSWWSLWREEEIEPPSNGAATSTKAKQGRLRLVRTGAELAYYAAESPNSDFNLLKLNSKFGNDDLRQINFSGSTGGERAELDVRAADLRVRAEAITLRGHNNLVVNTKKQDQAANPANPVATAEASNQAHLDWLGLILILGVLMMLACAGTLGTFLYLRRRKPSAPAAEEQNGEALETAAAPVAFVCNACGKKLKAKAAHAGKRIKCPQCAATVAVPATM